MSLSAVGLLVGIFTSFSALASNEDAFVVAVIRHEVANRTIDGKSAFCISIDGHDVSEAVIASLRDIGLRVMPSQTGCDQRIPFGKPKALKDGTFEVSYGFFTSECANCSPQGHAMFATMRHDMNGWHVLTVRGGVWL